MKQGIRNCLLCLHAIFPPVDSSFGQVLSQDAGQQNVSCQLGDFLEHVDFHLTCATGVDSFFKINYEFLYDTTRQLDHLLKFAGVKRGSYSLAPCFLALRRKIEQD